MEVVNNVLFLSRLYPSSFKNFISTKGEIKEAKNINELIEEILSLGKDKLYGIEIIDLGQNEFDIVGLLIFLRLLYNRSQDNLDNSKTINVLEIFPNLKIVIMSRNNFGKITKEGIIKLRKYFGDSVVIDLRRTGIKKSIIEDIYPTVQPLLYLSDSEIGNYKSIYSNDHINILESELYKSYQYNFRKRCKTIGF